MTGSFLPAEPSEASRRRQTGRLREARRSYTLNAEEEPDYLASPTALSVAYLELGRTMRALESYRRVLSMNPERYGCPASCCRDLRFGLLARR
jgi:hypothetical protein